MDDVGVGMLLRFKVILQRGNLFIPTLYRLIQLCGAPLMVYKVWFGDFSLH